MTRPGSEWVAAFRDVTLIVVGVLIALGVDQAVQTAGERRREAQYLEALAEEIEADLGQLQGPLREGLEQREAAAQLVIAALNGQTMEPSFIVAALDRAGHVSFFVPRRATFDDLVSTGNLRLIRDRRVRAALIAYYDVTELNAANELIRQEIWYGYRSTLEEVLDPLVLAQVTSIEGDATRNTIDEFAAAIPSELASSGLRLAALRENARFRSGIGSALEYTYFQRRRHSARIADAETVLEAVRGAVR
jgi:hypothetical protein